MSKFPTIALVVAAGTGTRFGSQTPKQYALLGHKPVLMHSLDILLNHKEIDAVSVVIHPEHAALYNSLCPKHPKLLPPILGGKERQDSVRLGLQALAIHHPQTALIHDAARPGVTAALIDRLLVAHATGHAAVIPALPVSDTVKKVQQNKVIETMDRRDLAHVQTPQCFDYAALFTLHKNTQALYTDDAALFEAAGKQVYTVAGEPLNFKITTREDWEMMQHHLEATLETRVGMGYDVHKFNITGEYLMLCGVKIQSCRGLEGHSDADVGLHALVDALLGAASEGDIGVHFPPSDPKWRGADSAQFVTYARDLIRNKGGIIVHVDITMICEKPKVGPHRDAMRQRIAQLLEIDLSRVSIKATTTEKLGFIGREEGIAAQAIATVKLPA